MAHQRSRKDKKRVKPDWKPHSGKGGNGNGNGGGKSPRTNPAIARRAQ